MCRLVLAVALFPLLAAAQEAAAGALTGVVVDELTGRPVPGAVLGLGPISQLQSTSTARSDAAGKFRFPAVKPGRYWIECRSEGYVRVMGYRLDGPVIDVAAAGGGADVTIRLTPEAVIEGILLSGRGEPIAGASVEAHLRDADAVTTGADGRFTLRGLAPGDCRLKAVLNESTRRDHVAHTPGGPRLGLPTRSFYPGVRSAAEASPLAVAKAARLTGVVFRIPLAPVVSIAGTVVDPATGAPLETGMIELLPPDGGTAAEGIPRRLLTDGAFRFDLLPQGTWRVHVFRGVGIRPNVSTLTIEAGLTDISDLRLVLPSGGRLAGRVIGPRNAADAAILLTPLGSYSHNSVSIAEDGSFTFERLAPGKFTVGFSGRTGGAPFTVTAIRQGGRPVGLVTVADGDNPPVEIETGTMRMVNGRVLDAAGAPVENAVIVFESGGVRRMNVTGKDGVYKIGVPDGEYRVTALRGVTPPPSVSACPSSLAVRVAQDITGLNVVVCP